MTESLVEGDRAEPDAGDTPPEPALTAGAMLRAARERQGVHIAALAAAIKVSPRKLDALEGDRYAELPDATFTRALAQTVCRALKIDAQAVLAKLPRSGPGPFEQVPTGLNAPFRDRPNRSDAALGAPSGPLLWAGGALLLVAAAILFVPSGFWHLRGGKGSESMPTPASAPALPPAPAASAPTPAQSEAAASSAAAAVPVASAGSGSVMETVHAAPAPVPGQGSSAQGATISTTEASWVEVTNGAGQILFSRIVQPGEVVNLDGDPPMRLKIGNARATQLAFRGQAVDLAGVTRDNVARVELK